jgi:hypothetical protein
MDRKMKDGRNVSTQKLSRKDAKTQRKYDKARKRSAAVPAQMRYEENSLRLWAFA